MSDERAFLGSGWKFPIEVDEVTGRIKTSSYDEDISEAIKIILMTGKGERVMSGKFGCDMKKFVFEDFNYAVASDIERCVREALIAWEPRIGEVEVKCEQDKSNPSAIYISVKYRVMATNNLYNMVYPYYLSEGIGSV